VSRKKALAESSESQFKTFANRFAEVLGKSSRQWKKNRTVPPKKFLTDANIERFLAAQWTHGHNKATTQASKSYISWALKENRMKPFILANEGFYKDAFKYYKNLKKDKRWTSYMPNGAESMSEEEVKTIAKARVKDRRGRLRKDWLRDKVAAFALIHMGWHPVDCERAKLSNCEEKTFECNFSGLQKPCLQVNGVATKRPGQVVRNFFTCGCQKKHDPNNVHCEYAMVKMLMEELGEDEDGEQRAEKGLFWNHADLGFSWSDKQGLQHKTKIGAALQRINLREGVRPGEKLTGDMGRKTFVTLGRNFFLFPEQELRDKTHHKTAANFVKYIDPGYVNLSRETLVSRVFQSYEQGFYKPPMSGNVLLAIAEQNHKLKCLEDMISAMGVHMGVVGPSNTIKMIL